MYNWTWWNRFKTNILNKEPMPEPKKAYASAASEGAYNLIKLFEGLSLKAYPDPGSTDGIPITIGYGTTKYPDGKAVKMGEVVTMTRADELLRYDVDKRAAAIARMDLKLNQNQFDAITSLVYNIGIGAFTTSTILKKIRQNPGDWSISDEFARWVRNAGKVMNGLVRRRKMEAELYFKPID